MKREYDWSSMVHKVAIVDAPARTTWPTKSVAAPADAPTHVPVPAPGTVVCEFEPPPMQVSWIPDDVPATKENLLTALAVTEEERRRIWSIEQRDPEWLRHRLGRISGSKVGSAAGHNKYDTPDKLVKNWLYVPVVDNSAMKWGRDNEDPAREAYRQERLKQFEHGKYAIEFTAPPRYLPEEFRTIDNVTPVDPNAVSDKPYDIQVEVKGLIVHPTIHWFGYSPDGEVFETDDKGLLEIKCPMRGPYPEIPWYYYDQIQFGMFNLGLKWCDFYAWTPTQTKLERYAFNEDYWNHDLYPKIEDFYMNKFLPEAIVAIEKQRAYDPNVKVTKKKAVHI